MRTSIATTIKNCAFLVITGCTTALLLAPTPSIAEDTRTKEEIAADLEAKRLVNAQTAFNLEKARRELQAAEEKARVDASIAADKLAYDRAVVERNKLDGLATAFGQRGTFTTDAGAGKLEVELLAGRRAAVIAAAVARAYPADKVTPVAGKEECAGITPAHAFVVGAGWRSSPAVLVVLKSERNLWAIQIGAAAADVERAATTLDKAIVRAGRSASGGTGLLADTLSDSKIREAITKSLDPGGTPPAATDKGDAELAIAGAAVTAVSPIVPIVTAALAAMKTDIDVKSFEETTEGEPILVTAVANALRTNTRAVHAPGLFPVSFAGGPSRAIADSVQRLLVDAVALGGAPAVYATKRADVVARIAALREAKQAERADALAAALAAFDIAIARATALSKLVGDWAATLIDPAKGEKLLAAMKEGETRCRMGETTRIVQLRVATYGGSTVKRTGVFTGWFGGTPLFVSGGGVVTYTVSVAGTGEVLAGGTVGGASELCRVRLVGRDDARACGNETAR